MESTPKAIIEAARQNKGTDKGKVFERLCNWEYMRQVWPLVLKHTPPGTDPDAWELRFAEQVWEAYQNATGPHKTITQMIEDLEDLKRTLKKSCRQLKHHTFADPFGQTGNELEASLRRIERRIELLTTPEQLIELQMGMWEKPDGSFELQTETIISPATYPVLPKPNIPHANETYFVRVMGFWFLQNLKGTHLTRLADLACCVFQGGDVADWLAMEFCNNVISKWPPIRSVKTRLIKYGR